MRCRTNAHLTGLNHYLTVESDAYGELIDEFPKLRFDRERSVRTQVTLGDSDLQIYLELQCSANLRPDGRVASLRVIGLRLKFYSYQQTTEYTDEILQFFPWLISGATLVTRCKMCKCE